RRREPVIRPEPVTSLGRLVATKQVDHVADMRAEKGYVDSHPGPVSLVELAGARTVINVPMLKERELIGCIALYRQEVRPFTDKQIALLQWPQRRRPQQSRLSSPLVATQCGLVWSEA